MGHDVSVLQARFFDQLAVGDDFQARGRGNEEFDRGLVVGVFYRWEPVARAVGPVVAEDREVAELVLADNQSVRRPPVVFDRNPAPVAATVISRKRDAELAARMCELRFALIFVDTINGQSHKIERDRFHPVLFELEEDFRLGLNLVARVFDRQAQPVMNGVERRVARVIVGGDGQDALRIKRQDENELGEPFHRKGSFPLLRAVVIACTPRGGRRHREGVSLLPPSPWRLPPRAAKPIYIIISTSSPTRATPLLIIRPTWPHWPKSRFGRRLSIFVIERQGLRASAISMTASPMRSRAPGLRESRSMFSVKRLALRLPAEASKPSFCISRKVSAANRLTWRSGSRPAWLSPRSP